MKKTLQKKGLAAKIRKLTDAELDQVSGGQQGPKNAGGGPGNSGPGDKNSPVQGPPPGPDHNFPGGGGGGGGGG